MNARVHGGVFSSLYVPNYRLFFSGMMVSNIGLWMFRVAQDWLVLTELTEHSSTALGAITGLQFLPILLFSAYFGSLVDRYDKRQLLMVTQLLAFLVAATQAVLVITGLVRLSHVMILAFCSGAVTAVDNPARQVFVSEIVSLQILVGILRLLFGHRASCLVVSQVIAQPVTAGRPPADSSPRLLSRPPW